jgi:hypothetical protein
MCLYLTKRGSTYYFRRVIPLELRPAFAGAGEFMFSLRTKDKEDAKRKRSTAALRTDDGLDAARARLASLSAPEAPPRHDSGISEAAHDQMDWERREDAEREARRESREAIRESLEARLELSTAEITPQEAAMRDILRDRAYEFTIREERQLIRRAHRAEERRGHVGGGPSSIALPAPQPPAEESGAPMLGGLIVDLWAAERKVQPKGKDAHRAVAKWFYDRVGTKPVAQISRKDVLAFKAALVAEGQSPANIKMKLSRLRTLLQWAFENDYAEANAATGITIKDTDAAKNKRKEFDLASLSAIFSSPVFAEGQRPAGGKGEAAYWLPLLALFTGARLEELGQLRPGDVAEERYPDALAKLPAFSCIETLALLQLLNRGEMEEAAKRVIVLLEIWHVEDLIGPDRLHHGSRYAVLFLNSHRDGAAFSS